MFLIKSRFIPILLVIMISTAVSGDRLSEWQARLDAKSEQINTIENELDSVKTEHQKVIAEFANAKKNTADRKNEYLNAEKDYNRGAENVDLIGPDKLAELAREKVKTQRAYQDAQDKEQRLENEKNKLEKDIARLEKLKVDKETEILEIKADMFDAQMAEPVWEEGCGESILDEDKTMKECKRLALEYARRDAMDKGGKTIIKTLTKIEDFKLIKDVIKSQAKVQIVEQDNSGDYGKAIRIMEGDVIKFTVKVRLKLQSVDTYNPFREKIKEKEGTTQKEEVRSKRRIEQELKPEIKKVIGKLVRGEISRITIKGKGLQNTQIVEVNRTAIVADPVRHLTAKGRELKLTVTQDGNEVKTEICVPRESPGDKAVLNVIYIKDNERHVLNHKVDVVDPKPEVFYGTDHAVHAHGDWRVEQKAKSYWLYKVNSSHYGQLGGVYVFGVDAQDYDINASIIMRGRMFQDFGIIWHYQNNSNFIYWGLYAKAIGIRRNGSWSGGTITKLNFRCQPSKWHHVLIKVRGNRFEVYIDHNLMASGTDYSFSKGRPGVRTYTPQDGSFAYLEQTVYKR